MYDKIHYNKKKEKEKKKFNVTCRPEDYTVFSIQLSLW